MTTGFVDVAIRRPKRCINIATYRHTATKKSTAVQPAFFPTRISSQQCAATADLGFPSSRPPWWEADLMGGRLDGRLMGGRLGLDVRLVKLHWEAFFPSASCQALSGLLRTVNAHVEDGPALRLHLGCLGGERGWSGEMEGGLWIGWAPNRLCCADTLLSRVLLRQPLGPSSASRCPPPPPPHWSATPPFC